MPTAPAMQPSRTRTLTAQIAAAQVAWEVALASAKADPSPANVQDLREARARCRALEALLDE